MHAFHSEYLKSSQEKGVPNEVVNLVFDKNYSPIEAWRAYFNLSKKDLAQRIGVSQSAYSQYEKTQTLRKSTRLKIATALGISPDLLDF